MGCDQKRFPGSCLEQGGARKQEEQWPGHGRKQLLDFVFRVLTWAHSDDG
jgi:hypothetical protein